MAHFLEHSPLSKVGRPISKQQEAQEGRADTPPRLSKTLVGILGSGMSDRAGIYMTLLLVWPISLNIHHFPRSGGPFPRTFTTFQGLVAHFLEHSPLSKVWRPISKQQEAQEGRASPQGPYLLIGPGWPLRANSVGPGHPFAS